MQSGHYIVLIYLILQLVLIMGSMCRSIITANTNVSYSATANKSYMIAHSSVYATTTFIFT